MVQILSVYAASMGEGKRTISQNLAKILSQNNQKVLYVELDYFRPSFAITTGLSHPTKNTLSFMVNMKEKYSLKYEYFVTNAKEMITTNKRAGRHFNENIEFLTFPLEYDETLFPKLVENDKVLYYDIQTFSKSFVDSFRDSKYDQVIFVLPNDIQSVFTIPIMQQSDLVLNIVSTNPTSLIESNKIYTILQEIEELNIQSKWRTIIKKSSDAIPSSQFETFLSGQDIISIISNDVEVVKNDLTDDMASENFEIELSNAMKKLSLPVVGKEKKSFFKWGSDS